MIACKDVAFLNVALTSKETVEELQKLLNAQAMQACRAWFQDVETKKVLKIQAVALSNLLMEASMAIEDSKEIESQKSRLGEHLEKASGEKMLIQVMAGFKKLMEKLSGDDWEDALGALHWPWPAQFQQRLASSGVSAGRGRTQAGMRCLASV